MEELNKKKRFTILGFSIWKILAYFIIYSIVGYMLETAFGVVTKGVVESRKSFLYGPFCAIYGLGAVIMIVLLQYFKKNNNTLFFGGFIIGSVVEYLVSLIGEMILHVKWWDYSSIPLNVDGRICVFFSLFWGFLAIYLMTYINPKIDKLIDFIKEKVSTKLLKIITIILIIAMFIDCIITGIALKMFYTKLVVNHNVEIQNVEEYLFSYEEAYKDPEVKDFVDRYFSDEFMIRTFPNLKVTGKDGDIILAKDILNDINPYYFKIFTPKNKKVEIFEKQ